MRNHLKHGCMTLPEPGQPAPNMGHKSMEGMDMGEDRSMAMGSLPLPSMIGVIAATSACLLVAAWITSAFFAPITFR